LQTLFFFFRFFFFEVSITVKPACAG